MIKKMLVNLMIYLEILVVFLLVLINGLLAMSELAIVSSRKSRLKYLADQGSHGARAALSLIEDPNRFLSTVQIGITLVGILAGAFSGATLGQHLGAWLDAFAIISPYGKAVGIGITVVCITYLSLILGELVPKRIALGQPERIASLVAMPLRGLSLAAAPAVWVLHVSTEKALRVIGLSGSRETTVTEDEVKSLIAEGTRAGIFVPQEQGMIQGVLRLADRPINVIMTPRSQVTWIDVKSDRSTICDMVESNRFSRFLVCDGTVDRPIGAVHTKDLLPKALCHSDFSLTDLMMPLLLVPEHTPVLKVLDRFKNEKVHMAVVVDEHGSTEGIVTPTDLLESIVGDFPELEDNPAPPIVQRDDGSWLVDGTLPTDEVENITGLILGSHVKTLAGFVLHHIGRLPDPGDSFEYGNARFEILDMDGNRIDKVLIEIVGPFQNPMTL